MRKYFFVDRTAGDICDDGIDVSDIEQAQRPKCKYLTEHHINYDVDVQEMWNDSLKKAVEQGDTKRILAVKKRMSELGLGVSE